AGGLVFGITLVCVLVMPGSGSVLLEQRPAGDPVCRPGGGTSVCVWPEHEHRLAEAVTTADKVARAAEGVLSPPARYTEQGLVRGGSGGFTLDHSSRDLLHTLLLQATDSSKRWCDTEPEDQMQARMYAGLRLDAWLEARATGSRTLPSYDYSGDTSWQDEVRHVLPLPERDQKETARKWVSAMGAPC
ncbi:hypothetical protein NGM37_39285, partial [Streptomyces sp. TRM76130]|nr:hypothetical protein [Streptomyces sp. TRM76130]